jgi:hypothetical protein
MESRHRHQATAVRLGFRLLFRDAGEAVTPRTGRHRTGRNVQLNIKARAEAVEAFYAITDREKWVLGETFERAIYALKRELARENSPTA